MNSRNRYASNPTYGAAKRGPGKKKPELQEPDPAPYTPGQQPQAPYAQPNQQNPYGGAYSYAPNQQQAGPYGYSPNQRQGYPQQGYPQPPYQPQQAYPQQAQQASGYAPRQAPYPPQQMDYVVLPNQADMQAARMPMNDTWVKLLLLLVLPALFILTLIFPDQSLIKWCFTIGAIIGLGGMWFFSSFASSAKTTLSLVYIALLLMTVVTLFAPASVNRSNNNPNSANAAEASSNKGPGVVNPNQGSQSDGTDQANGNGDIGGFVENPSVPEPTPSSGPSEAEQQMRTFFQLWSNNQIEEALALCAPSWKSGLKSGNDPKTELFGILNVRRPSDVVVESVSGTDADSSRTITISVMIDKQNNRAPSKYRFQVLMLKENGTWYVSPVSLSSNEEIPTPDPNAATDADQGAQAMNEEGNVAYPNAYVAPTATPPPTKDTKIYYNAKGGKRYHIDPECPAVDKSYLPMTSFKYGDISTSKFKGLTPCGTCNAPSRP